MVPINDRDLKVADLHRYTQRFPVFVEFGNPPFSPEKKMNGVDGGRGPDSRDLSLRSAAGLQGSLLEGKGTTIVCLFT